MNTRKSIKKQANSSDQNFLRPLLGRLKRLPQKHLLLASICLHLIFFSLLFINWQHQVPIKVIHIPQSISAHVVSADQVKVLQDKKTAEKKAHAKKIAEAQKKAAQKKKLLKEQALKKKKAKDAALKKAAEQKRKAKEKKLKLKKQKEKKAKQDKEKREKEKKAREKRELEEKRKVTERKKKELEEKRIAEAQQKKIQEQENKLLEKLQKIKQKQQLAETLAKAQAAEHALKAQQFLEYELSERERFTFLIRSKIENIWRKPPKSQGLKIILRIRLLPNGELSSVQVSSSSGNAAFDRSAILAVKSVRRYPVPEDSQVFESNFRQFSMAFSSEPDA